MALELHAYARPLSSIPKRTFGGFVVADRLGDLFKTGWGDATSFAPAVESQNPTISLDWAATPQLTTLQNIGFAQFVKGGEIKIGGGARVANSRAGVYILPRDAVLDSRIGDNAEDIPGGNTDLNWDAVSGTWTTVVARGGADSGQGTAIFNRGSEVLSVAESRGNIPANRCLKVGFELSGKDPSGPQGGFRFEWGGRWSFVLRAGSKPSLERKMVEQGSTAWQKVMVLNDFAGSNLFTGRYQAYILRLDGKLVFLLDSLSGGKQYLWTLDNFLEPDGKTTPPDVNWPAAKLRVTAYNCRARVEVSTVMWSDASGTAYTATMGRTLKKRQFIPSGQTATATCGGWKREGVTAAVVATVNDQSLDYELTLTASSDGIATPFVDKIGVRYTPVFTNPSLSNVDLRPAIVDASVSFGLPPVLNGNEATLNLDMHVLASKCTGWEDVTKQWCPVRITAKRFGSYSSHLHEGYIFQRRVVDNGIGQRFLSLTLRDDTMRLSKTGDVNHAAIDHRYPPMDLIFAERISGGLRENGSVISGKIYGGDLVKEILRIAMGDDVADSLNGNGNVTRYVPTNHPALLAPEIDAGGWLAMQNLLGENVPGLTNAGFMFPPPFGDSALDWINKIAGLDRCVFYYGWPDGDMSAPAVPLYGRYLNLLSIVSKYTVTDTNYGNITRLINQYDNERRGDKDVNEILVWGKEPEGLESILPSLRMALSRLDGADPRREELSWRRTQIIRNSLAQLPGNAEALANAIIAQLTGIDLQYPSIEVRGDERWRLGDIMTVKADGSASNANGDLDDNSYRIERIDHLFKPGGPDVGFTTKLYPRALSTFEKALL